MKYHLTNAFLGFGVGLLILVGSASPAHAQSTEPVTQDHLKTALTEQLNSLLLQYIQVLQTEMAKQTVIIESFVETQTSSVGGSGVSSPVSNFGSLPVNGQSATSSDPAVSALRAEIENHRALLIMCANKKNRAVNATVDTLCREERL